jgi:hypothetical protein
MLGKKRWDGKLEDKRSHAQPKSHRTRSKHTYITKEYLEVTAYNNIAFSVLLHLIFMHAEQRKSQKSFVILA